MAVRKRDSGIKERLDRIGRALVRASAANEKEAEAAASSPFLYTRLRSRIAAERERREEGERWLALLGVVWHAAPALLLVAVFAFALFWSATPATRTARSFSVESMLEARDTLGIEQVVFADRQSISSDDDVLKSILNDDEREAAR